MLEVKNLSKTFVVSQRDSLFTSHKTKKKAVVDLNVRIPKGKIIGLVGINGAGKTTTIKMLTTLLEPDFGEIIYDGQKLSKNMNAIRKKINMIAGGERNLYWRLSAVENLQYFGALYNIKSSILDKRIPQLLSLVGLDESKDMTVERYSKGMKQRLQIAKGLINDPDYIFLDEPTLGLDIKIAKELRAYILKIAHENNKGILLTTHYLKEVEELCDYVYVIDQGSVLLEGTIQDVISTLHGKNHYVFNVLKLSQKESLDLNQLFKVGLSIEDNEDITLITLESDAYSLQEVMEMIMKLNLTILSVEQKTPSLEDVLLQLQYRMDGDVSG